MIRILLMADVTLLRSSLAAVLSHEADMDVVAELNCSDDVGPPAEALRPDVAVLDVDLRRGAALSVAHALRAARPECETILLVGLDAAGRLHRALDSRVRGVLSKDSGPGQLVRAIRTVARGERVIEPALAIAALSTPRNPLTTREQDVLRLAANGAPTAEICDQLFLAGGTVRNYLSSILRKTGCRNRVEAVRTAELAGWL